MFLFCLHFIFFVLLKKKKLENRKIQKEFLMVVES
jgi:hypothetical protein